MKVRVMFIGTLNEKDLEILLFVNKYKYVKVSDFKYLYSNKQYYKNKIKCLINRMYLRKIKWYVTIGNEGKKYLENLGYKCSRISYEKTYVERQKIISSFAARFYSNNNIRFVPSIDIKDKQVFTITSRRYIGIMNIDKVDYLTYYISRKHTSKYIQSVIYDIRKERKFNNVIIFCENIDMIDVNDFVFGLDRLYVIPFNEDNLELLEHINKIDYQKLFRKMYKNKVFLSEYDFCDYYIKNDRFIFPLIFIDTERLSTIKYFLLENRDKCVDIIYSKNISLILINRIKGVNYIPVDYTKYIKGEFNIYD